tara:strand:- start:637 stop:885 length:249 start_codon:yes stop_codon:yes gene_type:complete
MFKNMKQIVETFINIFVVMVLFSCVTTILFGASVLITNIVNALRLTGYLNITFGISVVVVYFIMVWFPIWITSYAKNVKKQR